jgi:hypothetical protein
LISITQKHVVQDKQFVRINITYEFFVVSTIWEKYLGKKFSYKEMQLRGLVEAPFVATMYFQQFL